MKMKTRDVAPPAAHKRKRRHLGDGVSSNSSDDSAIVPA
ncbi:hypothetical protein BURCENBC7_AP6212 [Burkholderia cenocepacia BC7]|jgi:hypothetical protein|nr:hypothetical protein BURCENK562V_C2003 [Burkholderia cenocepacia K56-2Valvano]ERI29978.1 hypothetical protein BURCENBC7_AP6212 [Burkholderia cenocepacia BC7]CDN59695.1 hypothetical protein I35_1172 [Burkholderia cenocepacia H111]